MLPVLLFFVFFLVAVLFPLAVLFTDQHADKQCENTHENIENTGHDLTSTNPASGYFCSILPRNRDFLTIRTRIYQCFKKYSHVNLSMGFL